MDSVALASTAVQKANSNGQRRDDQSTESSQQAAYEMAVSIESPEDSHSDLIITHHNDDLKKLSFPAKLHAILSHWDIEDIVSWMPHGRAWRIHDPEGFQRLIMPRFFHKCKYTSFLRQLNGWGFRRMRCMTPDWNAFHHDYFLRGDLQKCRQMVRPSASVTTSVQNQHFCDPDFYSMEFIPELKKKFCFNKPESVVDQTLSKKRANGDMKKYGTVKKRRSESEAVTSKVPGVSEVMNGQVDQGLAFTAIHNLNPVLGTNTETIAHPYRLLSNDPIPSRMGGLLLDAICGGINRAPSVHQYRQSTQLLPYLNLSCATAAPQAAVTSHLALIAPHSMRSISDPTPMRLGSGLAAAQSPLYERLSLFPSPFALEIQSIALERAREEARVNAAIRLGIPKVLERSQPLTHRYPVSDAGSYGIPSVAGVDPLYCWRHALCLTWKSV